MNIINEPYQIIDGDCKFNLEAKNALSETDFSSLGFDYTVVTVLGSQSSGKSTLLNELFATHFDVLDSLSGRFQTTQGCWLNLSRDMKSPVVVIDVEGTDSRERGEDRLTFEHRICLFGLAIADVILINMWYHDIGRYTASNYGLLKTVLEVNLQLFQKYDKIPKTTLLFIIRDFSEELTPLNKIQQAIYSDITEIWTLLKKPENLVKSTVNDFFKLDMFGLPSKITNENEFKSSINILRNKYNNEVCIRKYSRDVPSDGFYSYTHNVWNTILNQSELDIPSQREMLASFRCDEIKSVTLTKFLPQITDKFNQLQNKNVPDLTSWITQLANDMIDDYMIKASKYQESICLKKKEQLIEALIIELQKIVNLHLNIHKTKILTSMRNELQRIITSCQKNNILLWTEFSDIAAQCKQDAIHRLTVICEEINTCSNTFSNIKSDDKFNTISFINTLNDSIQSVIDRANEKELNNFTEYLSSETLNRFKELEELLQDPNCDMQIFNNTIYNIYKKTCKDISDTYFDCWKGLKRNDNSEEWEQYVDSLVINQCKTKLTVILEWLHTYIIQRFQNSFNSDSEGVPQQWPEHTSKSIKDIYIKSRKLALVALDVVIGVTINGEKLIHIDDSFKTVIENRASKVMQRICHEAQMLQTASYQRTSIPWWYIIILIILGWNEFMAVMSSPFMLILFVLAGSVLGISYYTGNSELPKKLINLCMQSAASILLPILQLFHTNDSYAPNKND